VPVASGAALGYARGREHCLRLRQRCGACCCNPDENRAEGYPWYVEVPADSRLLQREELRKRYVGRDSEGVPRARAVGAPGSAHGTTRA
jgi:hypothetical protein